MPIRKKIFNENFVIVRLNKQLLVRYIILFLFNKLLSSYLLRINLLDNKYSNFPNYDMKGYKINSPRSLSARSCYLQSKILILESQFRLYRLDCVLQSCLQIYNRLKNRIYTLVTLSEGIIQITIISSIVDYYIDLL